MENRIHIQMIPNEMLKIIPVFDGNKHQLNLFIRKCEYILAKYRGDDEQNLYVMYAITSRLTGDAATLFSEREDINSWEDFKELLIQHFGDPRSEECIAIELEGLRIRTNESYLDFCHRIQSVRSTLISKVNRIIDCNIRSSKIAIYNNTSLNVFLYNLPENMVRIVRLKAPSTLEEALSVVMEEVNFHEQYTLRNKMYGNNNNKPLQNTVPNNPTFKFGTSNLNMNPPLGFRPNLATNKFNFGIPQQRLPLINNNNNSQHFGYRPQLYMRPQQFGMRPQQFGMQTHAFNKPQFGMRPQHFGNQQHNFYKPPQFGYKPQLDKKSDNNPSDVTMRTAPPVRTYPQGLKLNEIDLQTMYDDNPYDKMYPIPYDDCYYEEYQDTSDYVQYNEGNSFPNSEALSEAPLDVVGQDFHVEASQETEKK